MFGIQIVFMPSALAATFAAVPFLGTTLLRQMYWLPMVKSFKPFSASCHLLPIFIANTVICSDVIGGHPYMTGLAIVGGINCFAIALAIILASLLCCQVVVINMYMIMLQEETISLTDLTSQRWKKHSSFSNAVF